MIPLLASLQLFTRSNRNGPSKSMTLNLSAPAQGDDGSYRLWYWA